MKSLTSIPELNVLLLEDDFSLANDIQTYLNKKQLQCQVIYDGNLLIKQSSIQTYHIYILDINTPGMNGIKVCESLRMQDSRTPILMLTAFGDISFKIESFQAGADDYMVKPFHLEELYFRILALTRRSETPTKKKNIILVDDLKINLTEQTVTRGGELVNLTPKEFNLLKILAEANGRILSKQTIADNLWDTNVLSNYNTIEVYINFLRKKIDKGTSVKLIHTKIGFGYYLKAEL